MTSLAIELRSEGVGLKARYVNTGATPLALAFWWNRTMRVVDAAGRAVSPTKGSVLPCGVGEDWTVLAPGEAHERDEPLGCTQPAGRSENIGWSYELAPGAYTVVLVFEAPPAHGFSQSAPDARAFVGRVESNPVSLEIAAKKRGWFS